MYSYLFSTLRRYRYCSCFSCLLILIYNNNVNTAQLMFPDLHVVAMTGLNMAIKKHNGFVIACSKK